MPIVHTVAFKAKEGQDDALAKASDHFFAELKAGKVPGITPIYFGKIHYNLDRCAPFDRILYMVAQDEASLQAYGPSATHMDYVKEITPLVEKAFIADFPVDRVAYNLVHIVNFNVAPGKEEDWKTGAGHLIASSKAGSGILPIDIIYAGAMVGAHNTGVNHVLYTEFEKKADLDVYGPHDAHQHAVVNFLRPSSASPAVVFDFEAGPAPQ